MDNYREKKKFFDPSQKIMNIQFKFFAFLEFCIKSDYFHRWRRKILRR